MELPNEIWDLIVKQSKKSNKDIIKDKNLNELFDLEKEINEQKNKMYDAIKSKLNKYDIIKVTHRTDKNAYNCDLLITNLNLNNSNEISISNLNKCNEKCIFGNYKNGDIFSFQVDLNNIDIEVISTLEDRNNENIKFANSLKIGDVFVYSNYTSTEWVKHRSRYIDLESFKDSFVYGIVNNITDEKIQLFIRILNTRLTYGIRYINKNIVLKKLNFEENQELYMKLKKEYFIDNLKIDIKLGNTSDVKVLIKIQKRLKIRS